MATNVSLGKNDSAAVFRADGNTELFVPADEDSNPAMAVKMIMFLLDHPKVAEDLQAMVAHEGRNGTT